jgi:steroid 5-alpha reductase family enzyme
MALSRTFIFETAVVILYMTAWFVVAQSRHRNDVADVAWGFGFLLVAVTSLLLHEPASRPLLVTALVAAWGIRLSLHVYFRNRGKPEDFRYRKWREEWGTSFYVRSYLQVFLLQSILLVLVSTPVIYVSAAENPPLTNTDVVGVFVWMIGFLFEAVGDDLDVKFGKSFLKMMKPKDGETVLFSFIVYKSRADRVKVNAKVMADPPTLWRLPRIRNIRRGGMEMGKAPRVYQEYGAVAGELALLYRVRGIGTMRKRPKRARKTGNGLSPSVTSTRYPLNAYLATSIRLAR